VHLPNKILTTIDCLLQASHHSVCLFCDGSEHSEPFILFQLLPENICIILHGFPLDDKYRMLADQYSLFGVGGIIGLVLEGGNRFRHGFHAVGDSLKAFVKGHESFVDDEGRGGCIA
jgi:hypothetical protein